jgi:hypothetical protein
MDQGPPALILEVSKRLNTPGNVRTGSSGKKENSFWIAAVLQRRSFGEG